MDVCSPQLGHMIKIAATPTYGKTLKKVFFSGTKGPMALGLGLQHWGHRPNKIETERFQYIVCVGVYSL